MTGFGKRLLAAIGLAIVSACGAPKSYRVRMIVEVDTIRSPACSREYVDLIACNLKHPCLGSSNDAASYVHEGRRGRTRRERQFQAVRPFQRKRPTWLTTSAKPQRTAIPRPDSSLDGHPLTLEPLGRGDDITRGGDRLTAREQQERAQPEGDEGVSGSHHRGLRADPERQACGLFFRFEPVRALALARIRSPLCATRFLQFDRLS